MFALSSYVSYQLTRGELEKYTKSNLTHIENTIFQFSKEIIDNIYEYHKNGNDEKAKEELSILKSHLTNVKVGNTGFPFIIDRKGNYIIHKMPDVEGKNWKGKDFIDYMIEHKNGFYKYKSPKTGEIKYVAFKYHKNMDWIVVSGMWEKEYKDIFNTIKLTSLKTIVLVLIILIPIFILLIITVLRPIRKIGMIMKDLSSGQGDLTARINISNEDEIGDLANLFNTFLNKIHILIKEVVEVNLKLIKLVENLAMTANTLAAQAEELSAQTQTVSSASEEINVNSHNISQSAENSHESVSAVVESISEMSSNINTVAAAVEENSANVSSIVDVVKKVSANVDDINSSIDEISSATNQSSVAVDEMSNSLSEISTRTERAKGISNEAANKIEVADKSMFHLQNAASSISKVINLINDIADQTNMLALNATIEAASAGDAGKGFAVVANEVKELAKQTNDATASITTEINTMLASVDETAKAIKDVSSVISEVEDINTGIAKNVNQQNLTIRDIADTISLTANNSVSVAQKAKIILEFTEEVFRNITELKVGIDEINKNAAQATLFAESVQQSGEQTKQKVRTITIQTTEISSAINEISENIIGVADVSQETAIRSEDINKVSEDLTKLTEKLEELFGKFTI